MAAPPKARSESRARGKRPLYETRPPNYYKLIKKPVSKLDLGSRQETKANDGPLKMRTVGIATGMVGS